MAVALGVKKMTVHEFRNLEFAENDRHWYELLDGELVKKKAPTPAHQRVARKLTLALDAFISQNNLGELFFAPVDVFLDDTNSPQPDLVFVATANEAIVTDNGIEGVPQLVVEIISPTSVVRDRFTKKDLYERFGVKEYWIVDPSNQEIEIYTLNNERYELLSAASVLEGELKSAVPDDLVLDVKTLF
ncbi:Uma2 family endonuclease [Nibrella saemangeumensis]